MEIKDILSKSYTQNGNENVIEINSENTVKLCEYMQEELKYQLVSMFANDERKIIDCFCIYYIFADREKGEFIIVKSLLTPNEMIFQSISNFIFAATLYEREIYDMFGLIPEGHPDLRRFVHHQNWPKETYPLDKDFKLNTKIPISNIEREFLKVSGNGVFEIPVGPVHAGIIEPGHFRFSVAGEPILNLEAQLFYVHKGIEKLSESMDFNRAYYVAERISGDETFTNSLAYCQAVEKLAKVEVPARAKYTRILFAELERLTAHLGDLAGICLDVGYGFGAFQFRMMRGWAYLIADELCGYRFLRNVNKIGGVRKEFLLNKEENIFKAIGKIKKELEDTEKIVKNNSLFMDRVETTGLITLKLIHDLNIVGPPARAAGYKFDARTSYKYSNYDKIDFDIPTFMSGDVLGRMNVKFQESFQSIKLMISAIKDMPNGDISVKIGNIEPYSFAIGVTESPRGENIHFVMADKNNKIFRYKIRTPSFCNWPAVCSAVKKNIVPDFPLINKSFNLSYAGNDL